MSAFAERFEELTQRRQELESTIRAGLSHLAEQTLVEIDISGEPFDELVHRLSVLQARQASLTQNRTRIGELVDRITEIGSTSEHLQSEIRDIADKIEPLQTEIGSVAFTVYHDNPLVDQEYADIFAPLLETHGEIKDIDAQIAALESELESRQFLEKVVSRGKVVLLKNRRSGREATARKLHRKVGEEIMNTGFASAIDDPSLTRTVEPYLEQMKQSRSREREVMDLADERDTLAAELDSLGAAKRPQRRVQEIDEELETIGRERTSALSELGRLLVDEGHDLLPESTSSAVDELEKQEKQLAGIQDRLTRLRAAMAVERLNSELDELRNSVRKKRQQTEQLETEIKDVNASIASVEKDRKKKESARGPAEDLLK